MSKRRMPPVMPAIVSSGEDGVLTETSWPELRRKVAALALHLKAQGVRSGDRVAAYLPNIPETMIAFLATASIGAVWSVCAPDMAAPAVIDRFKQIEPKILIACDGVTYAGRRHDRRDVIEELRARAADGRACHRPQRRRRRDGGIRCPACRPSSSATGAEIDAFEPEWLPFDHPLWIVYSSGTTGLPKPIVHGHGGVILVALPLNVLHNDIGCSYRPDSLGERYHWYSSTGWIMWNCQVAGLLNGTTICIFDGSPGGSKDKPDWATLWRFVADAEGDVLRRRRGVLCQLHQGRDRSRRSPAICRACARSARPDRRSRADTQQWFNDRFAAWPTSTAARRRPRCGGPTCPAVPTSPAPSSAPTANCRRRRD